MYNSAETIRNTWWIFRNPCRIAEAFKSDQCVFVIQWITIDKPDKNPIDVTDRILEMIEMSGKIEVPFTNTVPYAF